MSITIRVDGPPKTAAPITTVAGAWLDGGQAVIRRQVREGFGEYAPEKAEDVGIDIVCRQVGGASLLSVVKNIVDGLDEYGIINTDRDVSTIRAAFDETDPAATVIVSHEIIDPSPPMERKYPSGALLAVTSETLAAPIGTRPLIAPSGEATGRDIDTYVDELLDQWQEVAREVDQETVEAVRRLPSGGPYRATVIVNSKKTADLENVVTRLVHLLHVAAYKDEALSPLEMWSRQPAIEDLITEVEAYRTALTPVGLTITITPIDNVTEPLIDLETIRKLRRTEVPLPQIELASDSPRLGRGRKARGPRA